MRYVQYRYRTELCDRYYVAGRVVPTADVSNEPSGFIFSVQQCCSASQQLQLRCCQTCSCEGNYLYSRTTNCTTGAACKIPDEWHQLAKTGSGRTMEKKFIIYKTTQFLCAPLRQIGNGGAAPFILNFGTGWTSLPVVLFQGKEPRVRATWAIERVWTIWIKVPYRETNRISLAVQPPAKSLQSMQYSGVCYDTDLQ
jgi:hypothetical protein